MGISMETRNQIVNFYPDKVVVEGQKINYGNIGDFDVVFGNFPVQERLVSHPKQPLLFSWKTRPALALEKANGRCEIHPLVYNNDIKAERIAVIRALAVHLGIEKQPSWHRRLLDRLEDLFRR